MSSILTNPSAITALQALRLTQASLASVQKQVSTGLKISSAADNASTFAIAQTIRSDQAVLSTISDSLNVSSSSLNVASSAVNGATTVLQNIKAAVAQATDPNADKNKILTSLQALGAQLNTIVTSASINGLNLLNGSTTSVSLIASYQDGGGAGPSTIGTINLTTTKLIGGGTGILEAAQATGSAAATNFTNLTSADLVLPGTATVTASTAYAAPAAAGTLVLSTGSNPSVNITIAASNTLAQTVSAINAATFQTGVTASTDSTNTKLVLAASNSVTIGAGSTAGTLTALGLSAGTTAGSAGTIGTTLSNADKAIADLTKYAATLGATQTSVTAQGSFIKTLNDALTQGVSALVDADLNEVSSRLQALQAQQQLGVQSLSIANQNSQTILALFSQR